MTILLHEFGIDREYWVDLLALVQSVLNHTPTATLDGLTPREVMTGLPRRDAVSGIFLPNTKRWVSVDWKKERVRASVERLRNSLDRLHTQVIQPIASRTKAANSARQRGVPPARFAPGDFVLWSKVDRIQHPDKLSVTWRGLYRVRDVSETSLIVEDIRDGKQEEVHPARVKFYRDKDLDLTERLRQHLEQQERVGVEALRAHRANEELGYTIEVKWRVLESAENTWEPINRIAKDVPVLFRAYVDSQRDRKFRRFVEERRLGGQ